MSSHEVDSEAAASLIAQLDAEAARDEQLGYAALKRAHRARAASRALQQVIGGDAVRSTAKGEPLPGLEADVVRPTDERPRGSAAILTVTAEEPGKVWSARDIHAELEERGWLNPEAQHPLRGTEAAISRLVRDGKLEKVGRGQYRHPLPVEE
jgi:hypothetical protein